MYQMNAPPAEWFDPKPKPANVPKETPAVVRKETRSKPDWLRTLEVYGFLFDAHARDKQPYK
jgi:hypothetical protein